MKEQKILDLVEKKAKEWLIGRYDDATKTDVSRMLENEDKTELIDSFYKDLEFGTGGLRGVMGAGSNRMNIYTVGAATQGLSNYLKTNFSYLQEIKVAIAYDCRNNSKLFAETAAEIFAANGLKVFIFDELRPTPELSFAIRELGCQSGIVITASHNPKEYNGYKVYWSDGSQIVPPHDGNIIREVAKVKIDDILFKGKEENISRIGENIDTLFLEKAVGVSLSPDIVKKYHDLTIVYTPIHGTGVRLIPAALAKMGFTNVNHVKEQDVVSGDFPTVASPNPEEPAAMSMAIAKAHEVNADVVMASDPDADRVGVVVKDDCGEYIILNGNQTALLFIYYILTRRKELGDLLKGDYVVKTIVTSELIAEIASKNHVDYYDTYTGFKYIAEVIRENEGKKRYIGGGEESFGFLPSDFVRDKDAVTSCALMAEITAWAKSKGKTLFQLLQNIYLEYGFSKEKMKYVVEKGKEGADIIRTMMENFRSNPPRTLGGARLVRVKDYLFLSERNLIDGEQTPIEQNLTSDVLQFFLEDGTKISVRPSGTEPKIKFYIEVRAILKSAEEYHAVDNACETKIDAIVRELINE